MLMLLIKEKTKNKMFHLFSSWYWILLVIAYIVCLFLTEIKS